MTEATPSFELRAFAPPKVWLGASGRFFDSCASSNDCLWQWSAEGAPHGAVVVATTQTRGRGRQGRRWHSEAGQGLYFSCLLRPAAPRPELPAFGLAAALAVVRTVEACCGLECGIKWPNDVRVGERKLAGLLLEARTSRRSLALVLGIGLNLREPAAGWPEELQDRAISLAELGWQGDAESIVSELCAQLAQAWTEFARDGIAACALEWKRCDQLAGHRIVYDRAGQWCEGVADGIAADGALRVRDDQGRLQHLVAGEVHLQKSHRP